MNYMKTGVIDTNIVGVINIAGVIDINITGSQI